MPKFERGNRVVSRVPLGYPEALPAGATGVVVRVLGPEDALSYLVHFDAMTCGHNNDPCNWQQGNGFWWCEPDEIEHMDG